MDNWLFDGQGVEFHHLQRAQQSRNQSQTNQLLQQQNELLRRTEEQRAQQNLPQCPHCQARITYGNIKPSRCPHCVATLFWADNVLHPFATHAQLEQHKARLRFSKDFGEVPSKIEKRITELRQACVWLTHGRLSNSEQGQLLQYLQASEAVVALVCKLQSGEQQGVVPGRFSALRELILQLATSAESQAVVGYTARHRQCVERLLAQCGYEMPDPRHRPLETPATPASPTTSREEQTATTVASPLAIPSNDPSGICEWFTSEVLSVLACVAVADHKLRTSEVSAIAETARTLGAALGEPVLRDMIITRCKEVSKRGVLVVLRELCHNLQMLRGSRPGRFLTQCAKTVATSEGPSGVPEREVLGILEEALGDPVSGLSISEDLV